MPETNNTTPETGPNAPGHSPGPPEGRTMAAVPIAMPPPARDPNHLRPREFDSRSVLQGYPIRVHPASIRHRRKEGSVHAAQPYGLRPKYPPAPPFKQWPGPRERGPQFQSIRALPRIPTPRVVRLPPAYAGQLIVLRAFPPLPDPIASSPVHPKAPLRAAPHPSLQPFPYGGAVLFVWCCRWSPADCVVRPSPLRAW